MSELNSEFSNTNILGQEEETWDEWWKDISPESEICKWDFFGLRPWILKYAPRNGRVLEAGCGLGRWIFYLSELGIDIEGIDFSEGVIAYLKDWQKENGFSIKFNVGDVKDLNYETASLSGYVSLGVIEHFFEGPEIPLKEACRVLRPGGIAIITTPSISWILPILRSKTKAKRFTKKILGLRVEDSKFFQYEYRPKKLMNFVKDSGMYVSQYGGCDLLATFNHLGRFSGDNLGAGSFAYMFSEKFERTFIRNWGAQSVTISVKIADEMFCFFCGEKSARKSSLMKYSVPVCFNCGNNHLLPYYKKEYKPQYHNPYLINPPILKPFKTRCSYCSVEFVTDKLFEKYGFSKDVCTSCLKDTLINLELSNTSLQPIWRKRK